MQVIRVTVAICKCLLNVFMIGSPLASMSDDGARKEGSFALRLFCWFRWGNAGEARLVYRRMARLIPSAAFVCSLSMNLQMSSVGRSALLRVALGRAYLGHCQAAWIPRYIHDCFTTGRISGRWGARCVPPSSLAALRVCGLRRVVIGRWHVPFRRGTFL